MTHAEFVEHARKVEGVVNALGRLIEATRIGAEVVGPALLVLAAMASRQRGIDREAFAQTARLAYDAAEPPTPEAQA